MATTLRDPIVYSAKHALASASPQRLDLQYQYLVHGWRRDPSSVPEARLTLREAAAFLRDRFDVVGIVDAKLFDAFIIRCSLRLTGRPDALLYVPANVASDCAGRRRLRRDPASLWVRASRDLSPTPSAAERRRRARDVGAPLCASASNASCRGLRTALVEDAAPASGYDDVRVPADVALYLATKASYEGAPESWERHVATFASAQTRHRRGHAHLEGTGTSCGVAKAPFAGACPAPLASAAVADVRGTGDQVARVTAANEWLSGRGEAPAHWTVTGPSRDLVLEPVAPWLGTTKSAQAARLRLDGSRYADVVIKRGRDRAASGLAPECVRYVTELELLALELLSGEAGAPRLIGAWRDGATAGLTYVVERPGASLGACGNATCAMSDAYLDAARRRPVDLVRGFVAAYAAFAEVGGFYLSDLTPAQFTLDPRSLAVSLIDAPRSFRSGLAEYFSSTRPGYRECDAVNVASVFTMDGVATARGRTCRKSRDCPKQRRRRCADASGKTDARCPPELRGRCVEALCVPLSDKSQVYDVAARPWLLPLILKLAPDDGTTRALAAIASRMTRPDPDDRPAFSDVLRELDALVAGNPPL